MRKILTVFTVFLILFSLETKANVIQYFTGISYNNPAELAKIKKNELIFGGTGFYVDARFQGSVLNFNTGQYGQGVNHTRTTSLLPYGRIAQRFNEKLVFAIDVTQPFHSNLDWGDKAFTRYAATQNFLTDTDYSPKIAIALNQKIQVGGGINLNFLKNNEVNFALPTGPTTFSTLTNRTSAFGTGYNLGLNLVLTQTDFLGVAYYSKIKQRTRGYSRLAGMVSNNHTFTFFMPATTVLSYTHLFNKKWLMNVQAFYTEWDANQFVRLFNTAASPPNFVFPMLFDPSWAFLGVVRQQYSENLGLSLIGMLDIGPEQDHLRTIVFPSDRQYFIGIAGDYQIKKNTVIQLIYGHGFSNTQISNRVKVDGQTVPFTTGPVNINADVVDLRLKIQA
ncbi:hypothetical protein E3983_04375 [Legionella israelensis]|uniref:Outer membrane protein n=1 Tax=Legionella israelensis TaxID=454 RepID=A0AAX1EEY5_9GAMM|nr:outer membrane protein transport protein [Legionella israelensis]QBR83661.1 hypothetical protein E3983_04375 [Legionella israelensis]